MEPPPPENTAWEYYGGIMGAAWQRGNVAGAWQAIHAASELTGRPLPTWSDVNTMYSFASSQRRAADRLASAPDAETDMTPFVTPTAGSRSLEQRNAVPRYTVRYETESPEEEGGGTQWWERSLGGALPESVGDIREQIQNSIELEEDESPPSGSSWTGNAFIVAR